MTLHLTKVAFGAGSIDDLIGWFANRPAITGHTTRYKPKRFADQKAVRPNLRLSLSRLAHPLRSAKTTGSNNPNPDCGAFMGNGV